MGERIVVGMSGGVDSSVAAALLVEQGHEVIGVTMRVWPRERSDVRRVGACCGADDVDDARRVAHRLGIPYYVLDMAREFERAVIDRFVADYAGGRTPVPCVACNSQLKFGTLLARARAWDAEAVATGHYARVERDAASGRWTLRRARDLRKDQSDFLWPLTQAQLAAARFPVGDLTKDEVRGHARRLGLPTADKAESQEICFVPDGDYRGFLRRRDATLFRPGEVVDRDGRVLGRHGGVANFTVGQRRGLGVPTTTPLYVLDIDAAGDRVTVGPAEALGAERLVASAVSFVEGVRPAGELRVSARIRHAHEPAPARLRALDADRVEVCFDSPQRAVTPGQSVVFYDGDRVVGGGVIARR